MVIGKNTIIILTAGTRFQVAGTVSEQWPALGTSCLARNLHPQGVFDAGAGTVRSPLGFYAELIDVAYDEAGVAYPSGTTVFVSPESRVQQAVKTGGGGKTGQPIEFIAGRPYPRSGKAFAAGAAAVAVAGIIAWVW